jgi:oligopeptide transport system substrate-binding protein
MLLCSKSYVTRAHLVKLIRISLQFSSRHAGSSGVNMSRQSATHFPGQTSVRGRPLSNHFLRFVQRKPPFALVFPLGNARLPCSSLIGNRFTWFPLIVLTMALLVVLAGQGCNSNTSQSPPTVHDSNGQILRRGIGGEPASLDPAEAADTFSFEVIRDLYEGLATESADGTVLPGVASSWTVDPTGTQYTFQLRPDAKWSNGIRVRAKDFVEAWRRVVDPKHASPVADTLRPVAGAAAVIAGRLPPSSLGVTAVGDDLLVVNLEQPAPFFPQLLTHSATFPVYSDEIARSHNPNNWVSNGPYVLSSWTPGLNIRLQRNLHYWDGTNVRISRVEYVPNPDENAEYRQYRAGQLDVTQSVPTSALDSVRAERPNELLIAPFLATAYYALNLHSPYFATNLNLRKSLAFAIDRKSLEATILPFGQRPAYGFVPPGTWNYDPQSWEWRDLPDSERLDEARRLYALAGFSVQKPMHLRVLFNSNNSIKQVAIAIASMWKQTLGIDTELIDEEYRVFLDSRRDTSRWDVARLGWTADYNDAGNFLDTLRSGSPNNDARYARQDFDKLLDRAASTIDSADRRQLLQNAEKMMLSDYPILPIYFFSSKRLIKPYVKGAKANPLNRLYSRHLAIEGN